MDGWIVELLNGLSTLPSYFMRFRPSPEWPFCCWPN